jgi:hypothetical protein
VGHDDFVEIAALGGDEGVGEAGLVFLDAPSILSGSPSSERKRISTAPFGPMTAISAVGQA